MVRRPPGWKVVQDVNHIKFLTTGVIVVEVDVDVIHFDKSSDLVLSTSLDDLDFTTLNIDGQSMDVDALPDIIDVDRDDDSTDDEDALPHDLEDYDDEDLTNDDDDNDDMSANVAQGHGGDGGGDDRLPLLQIGGGCQTKNKKAIEQHLAKIYIDNKSALKAEHWVPNPDDGTYDVEGVRSQRPANISQADWDAQLAFWLDPKHDARCAQNARNRAKSTVICRQGSRSLVVLRDMHEEMLRLQGLGPNTPTCVPYTDDEIMAIVRRGKQRGHLPGVGRVLVGQGGTSSSLDARTLPIFSHRMMWVVAAGVTGGEDDEDADEDEDEDADGDEDS
nr:hypothetical protein [Tanacetum cinerariifolium]